MKKWKNTDLTKEEIGIALSSFLTHIFIEIQGLGIKSAYKSMSCDEIIMILQALVREEIDEDLARQIFFKRFGEYI